MNSGKNLDFILKNWSYDADNICVRLVKGCDGRDLIQVRVDLGILQLETTGRPDGLKPEGFDTLLECLCHDELEDPDFELDDDTCMEIDREFVQYYHRRIAWLRLQYFDRAIQDADHTLALMDFCREHSPDEDWTLRHEQHRAFVIFHRTQAAALGAMEDQNAERAVDEIAAGLDQIRENFSEMGWDEHFESDELVQRLVQFRDSLRDDYSISLREQLDEAVAAEQYELAARLRDEITRRTGS